MALEKRVKSPVLTEVTRVKIPKGARWGWGIDRRNGTMTNPKEILEDLKVRKTKK